MIRLIKNYFKMNYFFNFVFMFVSCIIRAEVENSALNGRLPDGLDINKKLINQMNQYFSFKDIEAVFTTLYKICPEFFTKNPKDFFPLKTKNDKVVFDFIDACFPLHEYFSEMQWGETGLPVSVASIESSIRAMFLFPTPVDVSKLEGNSVICIPGATFSSMLARFLEAKKQLNDRIKGIYFLIREDRKNTKLSGERVKNISGEISLKLGRALRNDELEFIENHNDNEYEFVKVIQYFFDTENKTEIFFAKKESSKYEKCLDFTKFVVSLFPDLKNIIVVSHNIFTFYDRYIWQKTINTSSFSLSIIPMGYNLPLIDKKNIEGVLVRYIRLAVVLLEMMKENY